MSPGPQPMPAAPSNETLEQFLERREKELLARVSALRGQLYPAEAELTQIQQMKAVIGQGGAEGVNLLLPQRNHNALMEPALGVVPSGLSSPSALNTAVSQLSIAGIAPDTLSAVNPRFATATI